MLSPHSPVRESGTELGSRGERGVPPILDIPNEIMDQVVSELPDRAFAKFRQSAKCIWFVTLDAWNDRAMQDKDGTPVLMWAVKNNHAHLINYALAISPRMELNRPQEGKDSMSPLSIACGLGHSNVVRTLVSHGADINYCSDSAPKSTPLLYASRSSHHDTVQLLLELGADANALTQEGSSLVHIAAKYNQVDTLKVILDWGIAHPLSMPGAELRDGGGKTAMELAYGHRALGKWEVAMSLESPKCVKACVAHGRAVFPWVIGFLEVGFRPLIPSFLLGLACEQGGPLNISREQLIVSGHLLRVRIVQPTLEAVRVLADRGASLDGILPAGELATHFAIVSRDLQLLQLFLYEGWDINAVDQGGSSVVHRLAQQTYTKAFTLPALITLEAAGADMFLRNEAGQTPKDLAVQLDWPDSAIETFLDQDFIKYNENGKYVSAVMERVLTSLFSYAIFVVGFLSMIPSEYRQAAIIWGFLFTFVLSWIFGFMLAR